MARYDIALKNLSLPENASTNWFLGSILTKAATAGVPHFFLDELEKGRTPYIVSWNHWLSEFKAALTNPDEAPKKALLDVASVKDAQAESKLRAVLSEVLAVCILKKDGYKKFEVLLPSEKTKTPDFAAYRGRTKVKIEVKTLEAPKDRVGAIAKERWEENQRKNPSRYNFIAMLSHSTKGKITEAAAKRLRTLIDQLPDFKKDPIIETLDGGVHIQIEKKEGRKFLAAVPTTVTESMFENKNEGILIVRTAIGGHDLDFNKPEFQALFLKAFRSIASATTQVLASEADYNFPNVIALFWHPPDFLVDTGLPDYVQKKMERLFSSFDLKTKVIILYQAPDVPLALLQSTRNKKS